MFDPGFTGQGFGQGFGEGHGEGLDEELDQGLDEGLGDLPGLRDFARLAASFRGPLTSMERGH